MDGLTTADVKTLTSKLLAESAQLEEREFLGALFDAGLAWVHWPIGEGGLGLEPAMQDVIDTLLEGAGRRPDWLRNPMGVGMVGPAIAQCGRPDQRARFLRPIFTAEEIWCQLFSEPGAGSDVATLATRAVPDGDGWILDGQKVWTSAAHVARFGLILARSNPDVPKHRGITAFILDMGLPGVEVRPLRQMNGSAHFNEVFLSGVRVADTDRLGSVHGGWQVAVTTLANERVSIGGARVGRAGGEIAGALGVWQRVSGGPAERDALARLWVDAEVLRLGKLRGQAAREQGTPGPEGSVLKLADSLLSQRIRNLAVNLLGPAGMILSGAGYATGTASSEDVVLEMLAGQGLTIAGGTPEIQRNIIGERLLGLPPEPRSDRDIAWRDIPRGV